MHGFVIATAGAHGQFGLRVTKGTVPLERVFTLKPNTASSGLIASHVRDLAYTLEVLYGQKNHYSAKLIRNAPVGEIKVGIVGNFLQPINQYGDDMAVLMNYRPDPDMVQMLSGSFSDALRSVGINVKTVTFTPDEMTKLLSTSATFLAETSPESACGLISAKAAVNSYLSETPQTPYNNLAQWLQQRNFTSNGFYADFRSKLQQINSAPDSFTFSPCAKARRASSSLQLLFRNKLETENVNILLYPSSSGEPFRLNSLEFCPQDGYNYAVLGVSLPVYMGWPALAMPMGFSAGGLPYGAVGITEPFYEDLLLALGFAYENSASYQFRIPKDTPVIPGNTLISSKSQQFDQFGGLGQNLYPNVWATPSSVVYPNQYQPSYPLVQTGQTTPNPSAICYGNPFCRYPKKK